MFVCICEMSLPSKLSVLNKKIVSYFRSHVTRACSVQGVRRQVVRKALRRLLLRWLLLLLQAEHQEEDRLHLHLCVQEWIIEVANVTLDSKHGPISAGRGQCQIDKARRNWCPSCRLAICFRAKMNPNGEFNTEVEESSWTMQRNCVNRASRRLLPWWQPIEKGPRTFLGICIA